MARMGGIAGRVQTLLGTAVVATTAVAGGDICSATRVKLSDVNGRIEVRHANDNQTLSPAKDLNSSEDEDSDTI